MKKWIALFSHTGREIAEVSNRLGVEPYRIVCNKRADDPEICEDLDGITFVSKTPSITDYDAIFEEDTIITMHGWMRVIPAEICEKYNILNLHPGLITTYPELKGKDPQKKVFDMLNPPSRVGCVIHEASAELDSGKVLMERSVTNTFPSAEILTTYLHRMSWDMWVDFLPIYAGIRSEEENDQTME